MSTTFEATFALEDIRVRARRPQAEADRDEELEGFARCLNEVYDVEGGRELIRSGAVTRTLARRDAAIDAVVWGEPATATLTADGFGILVRAAVGTDRAQLLAKMPLELVVRGRVEEEQELPSARADVPPIREIRELALTSVEIRPAGPPTPSLEDLEQDQRTRVQRYVSEGD
jgi:hypothetical protein